MRLPSYAAETFTDNQQLTRMQAPTREVVSTLRGCPLINGAYVVQVFASGAAVAFAHKLGRQPVGWLVIDLDTAGVTFNRTAWNTQTITINPSAACTATFWVF